MLTASRMHTFLEVSKHFRTLTLDDNSYLFLTPLVADRKDAIWNRIIPALHLLCVLVHHGCLRCSLLRQLLFNSVSYTIALMP